MERQTTRRNCLNNNERAVLPIFPGGNDDGNIFLLPVTQESLLSGRTGGRAGEPASNTRSSTEYVQRLRHDWCGKLCTAVDRSRGGEQESNWGCEESIIN